MKNVNQERERVRKVYSSRGCRSQKMVSFRCDDDNLEWLLQKGNKGRLINQLIQDAREKEGGR